ncbi:MAG: TRAP transporter substrate-binding protein [Gammaproteobacteria bacterium]|nr:MAG: TRAP transporter substrate-binding protein [Gammaproteobacteria bacterium]
MIRIFSILIFSLAFTTVYGQTFKIATIVPDGTRWMKEMRQAADVIRQRTQGRIKFRFYPGGVMGNNSSVLRKIRIGQLHGGVLTSGGLSEIYPDSQIYNMPFVFNSYDEVDYVRARMDKLIIIGLKKKGFISFGLSESGFAYLMSNSPLQCIEDLKRQKVWAPQGDRISRTAFESLGVSPVSLPLTDVLTGLQTGLINTVASPPIGAIALQWHTRVKYLADIPLLYLYGTLVVKREAFERLSPEDQKIVQDIMGKTFRNINKQNRKDNQGARQALRNQGIKFTLPADCNGQRWNKIVTESMKKLAEKGQFSEAMLKTLRGHLYDYRQGSARK